MVYIKAIYSISFCRETQNIASLHEDPLQFINDKSNSNLFHISFYLKYHLG